MYIDVILLGDQWQESIHICLIQMYILKYFNFKLVKFVAVELRHTERWPHLLNQWSSTANGLPDQKRMSPMPWGTWENCTIPTSTFVGTYIITSESAERAVHCPRRWKIHHHLILEPSDNADATAWWCWPLKCLRWPWLLALCSPVCVRCKTIQSRC